MRNHSGRVLALSLLMALCGCASSRWLVVHVRGPDGAPVADATVSAVCGERGGSSARRTDSQGNATLELRYGDASPCVLTAEHEGYDTAQVEGPVACAKEPERREKCAPVELRLQP